MPLVHYRKWKKGKKLGPNSIILDPENYRLDRKTGRQLSQKEIIEQLVANEDVKGLAAMIVSDGYIPVEDIVIVEEDNKRYAVEGNRRLCAYKLLSKPSLAPKKDLKSFERLKDRAGDELPKQVFAVVAPNRAEANIYIFRKHADDGYNRRWQSIRQAAFVVGQLNAGATIAEVGAQTGMSRSQILEAVTALDIYRLAGSMNLSPKARELMVSPTKFPYTAIAERIFGSKEIRHRLGVEVGESGLRGVAGTRDKFLEVLSKIFEDLAEGTGMDAATRKYGTADLAKERVNRFIKEVELSTDKKESWKAFEPKSAPTDSTEPTNTTPPKKPARPPKLRPDKEMLLPSDLQVEIGPTKLRSLIEEAQRIDVSEFYHSAAVFLRCIFEMALNCAVSERKVKAKILAAHPKKTFRGEVSTSVLLEEVKSGGLLDLHLEEEAQRGVKHLIGDGPFSFDQFHLFVHNKHWPATKSDVSALREKILPILRAALLKPTP